MFCKLVFTEKINSLTEKIQCTCYCELRRLCLLERNLLVAVNDNPTFCFACSLAPSRPLLGGSVSEAS